LKTFSGDLCRVNRQGRGRMVLKHPCLAVLWLTQPDKVDSLLTAKTFGKSLQPTRRESGTWRNIRPDNALKSVRSLPPG
jgi:hypothetical protein